MQSKMHFSQRVCPAPILRIHTRFYSYDDDDDDDDDDDNGWV